tara:strand:- start:383 stop:493 length:111 start_codon:yes stop_codon:yes gene_type:complete
MGILEELIIYKFKKGEDYSSLSSFNRTGDKKWTNLY